MRRWLSGLAKMRKAIALCPNCRPLFSLSRHHYRYFAGPGGLCDACRKSTASVYVPVDALDAR